MHLTDGPHRLSEPSHPIAPGNPELPRDAPLWRAADLTQGGAVAQIDLGGQIYTLRITRAGKLILTK